MPAPFKRFTSFDFAQGIGYVEVFVNPVQIAYVQPRRRYDSKCDTHSLDGTLLFFQQEAGVLAVREDVGLVMASLQSKGGVCRSCYQELPQAWMSVCDECRCTRYNGVDHDPAEIGDAVSV